MLLSVALTANAPQTEGAAQSDGQRCAGSPYMVGDGFSWGYIKYIGLVLDAKNNVVGWIYSTDHQVMLLQVNRLMSRSDRRATGIAAGSSAENSIYVYTHNPWRDLRTGPCPDNFLSK